MAQIEKVLADGALKPDALILREKDLAPDDYTMLAKKVKAVCEAATVRFIAHTFIHEAIAVGADAIHLPMPVFLEMTDAEKDGFKAIGVSAHRLSDVSTAEDAGAAYATFSPIFPTQCKPGAAGTGTEALHRVVESAAIPIFALGGIHPENMDDCLNAGAAGVCMMSEYMIK